MFRDLFIQTPFSETKVLKKYFLPVLFVLTKMSSWSKQQQPKGKWYVVGGTAYDQTVAGENKTSLVTTNLANRDDFYYDPAVRLSEKDLDAHNGGEQLPICVEHNTDDVVGYVHHSWSGDGEKRALKVIARINQETDRGKQIVAELKAGRYKGFSIGYGAGLTTDKRTGQSVVDSKHLREISLVEKPFFENCHLSYGVTASRKTATNNANYLSNTANTGIHSEQRRFFIPITMSANEPQGTPSSDQLPTTQAQRAAVSGEEMMRQADSLKEKLNITDQEKEAIQRELDAHKLELAQYRAEKKAQQEAYAKEQEPKFQAYVQELEASRKAPLTAEQKEGYRTTMCDMRFREASKDLELQLKEKVELRASLKLAQDKAAAEEEKCKTLESSVNKTTAILNHSRGEFAKTIDNETQVMKEDEQRRKLDVEASGRLGLNEMMVPHPSIQEMPFVKAYGFVSELNVNASASDPYNGGRLYKRTMPVAATHRHLLDEDGNNNFPASARIHNPPFFSWMCDNSALINGSLDDVVHLNPKYNVIERKDNEAWEAKNRASGKLAAIE